MSDIIILRKTANWWEFESEAALEAFVRANLQRLLGLTYLKQQYAVNSQVCDLLALNGNRQLTVIELKNTEDRYILQQLTRYYDALQTVRPFPEVVDYTQPVRLMAIAPSFHRDNAIDRKYSTLVIQFLQFEILERDAELHLQLIDVDTREYSSIQIPYSPASSEVEPIASPSTALLKLLTRCAETEQQGFLLIREQTLRFDRRMQEMPTAGSIVYGRGKTKPCAELRFDSARNQLLFYLWLPHVVQRFKKQVFIARMRIWTDWNTISDIGHVPKGPGRMLSYSEWKAGVVRPLNKILPSQKELRDKYFTDTSYREAFVHRNRYLCKNPHYKSGLALPFENYIKLTEKPEQTNSLKALVQLALETWLGKL